VKPALPYLDIVAQVAAAAPVPVAAYQVSGEYAMIEAAAAQGWLDRHRAIMETLTGIKRARAGIILRYLAAQGARRLSSATSTRRRGAMLLRCRRLARTAAGPRHHLVSSAPYSARSAACPPHTRHHRKSSDRWGVGPPMVEVLPRRVRRPHAGRQAAAAGGYAQLGWPGGPGAGGPRPGVPRHRAAAPGATRPRARHGR